MTYLLPTSNGYLAIPDPYSETIATCPSCGEDYQAPSGPCGCPRYDEEGER